MISAGGFVVGAIVFLLVFMVIEINAQAKKMKAIEEEMRRSVSNIRTLMDQYNLLRDMSLSPWDYPPEGVVKDGILYTPRPRKTEKSAETE